MHSPIAHQDTAVREDLPPEPCYHCGLPVSRSTSYQSTLDGQPRAFCCAGCQAVAEAIDRAGLGEYYRHRTQPAQRPGSNSDFLKNLALFDEPAVQKSFVRTSRAHIKEAALILEGIHCAACVWLNERHLQNMPGVVDVSINYSTQRARVRWDETQVQLSSIIAAVAAIGYKAHPFDPGKREQILEEERKAMLRRIFVAGLGWAQVMMFAIALYAGDYYGMTPDMANFFRYVSLLFTTPIMFYSAWPFLRGAWRDIRRRQPGMDVPVSMGIVAAYAASVWNTLAQPGPVYYDTVTMFVFLLLGARFLEMSARRKASHALDALGKVIPAMARRAQAGDWEWVPAASIEIGDLLLVHPGETIPLDGEVVSGLSDVDESLLTGESRPISKGPGAEVAGGTVNQDGPLQIRVLRVGDDLLISGIARLLEQAQAERPPIAFLADRASRWFVSLVLLMALGAGLVWYFIDPDRVYWIVVSMLVVTCPCALGLATPVAITAATGRLAREGAIMTRGHALESMARVTHVVFDKTGTLSEGRMRIRASVLDVLDGADEQVWSLIAGLAQLSEHPLSRALVEAAHDRRLVLPRLGEGRNFPGEGMEADWEGETYRLGKLDFVGERSGVLPLEWQANIARWRQDGWSLVGMGRAGHWLAVYALGDVLRPDARQGVNMLKAEGYQVILLSGDHGDAVRQVAETLGIATWQASMRPQDKLDYIKGLQAQGAVVCMVGDGINDGPVLAGAQVSVAMGAGTAVARASADMVLLSNQLRQVLAALKLGKATIRIIRQNLAWAVLYNVLALPAAMTGLLTAWMAAVGMSISSLIVVANAMRLVRAEDASDELVNTPVLTEG